MATAKDEAPRLTPMQEEANRRADAAREDSPQERVVYTYPDGSQVVGAPPFPEKSPIEREAENRRLHAEAHGHVVRAAPGMVIPPGMKTEGAPAPSPLRNTTESEFIGKVEQQLASDIASGKSPDTPNPTTSSDKPNLAGIGRVPDPGDVVLQADPTPEELARIAASINVGDTVPRQPTEAEVESAVTQVARETKGMVLSDDANANIEKEEQAKRDKAAKDAEAAKAKAAPKK